MKTDTNKFLIAPSMLSCDFSNIGQELSDVDAAGADMIHWDVMDGHFVPNITFGAPVISKTRKASKNFFDVHLMITHPEKYLEDFIKAGSDLITIHIESTDKIKECFEVLEKAGVQKGLSLRPGTPLEEIKPHLASLDMVLVMTVEPGFGGQSFMEDQIKKVEDLYSLRKEHGYKYKIEIDGGMSDKTAPLVSKADVLVAGSFVFKENGKEGYASAIGKLKNAKRT